MSTSDISAIKTMLDTFHGLFDEAHLLWGPDGISITQFCNSKISLARVHIRPNRGDSNFPVGALEPGELCATAAAESDDDSDDADNDCLKRKRAPPKKRARKKKVPVYEAEEDYVATAPNTETDRYEYYWRAPVDCIIAIDPLYRYVKSIAAHEVLEWELRADSVGGAAIELHVRGKSQNRRTEGIITLNTGDPDYQPINVIQVEPHYTVDMRSADFRSELSMLKMATGGTTVALYVQPPGDGTTGGFVMSMQGQGNEVTTTVSHNKTLHIAQKDRRASASKPDEYSASMLLQFCRMERAAKVAHISMCGEGQPIKIGFRIIDMGTVEFYLAPKEMGQA